MYSYFAPATPSAPPHPGVTMYPRYGYEFDDTAPGAGRLRQYPLGTAPCRFRVETTSTSPATIPPSTIPTTQQLQRRSQVTKSVYSWDLTYLHGRQTDRSTSNVEMRHSYESGLQIEVPVRTTLPVAQISAADFEALLKAEVRTIVDIPRPGDDAEVVVKQAPTSSSTSLVAEISAADFEAMLPEKQCTDIRWVCYADVKELDVLPEKEVQDCHIELEMKVALIRRVKKQKLNFASVMTTDIKPPSTVRRRLQRSVVANVASQSQQQQQQQQRLRLRPSRSLAASAAELLQQRISWERRSVIVQSQRPQMCEEHIKFKAIVFD